MRLPNQRDIVLCDILVSATLTKYNGTSKSVTIPNNVTAIGAQAFSGCTGLTSVTFQGTISSSNFSDWGTGPFPGDLREMYLQNGPGTYTRARGSNNWDSPRGQGA